jgi:hypothetical protein
VSLAVSSAGALAATSTLTKADTALARGALLKRSDLGQGWSSDPAPTHVPPLTCSQYSPSLAGTVLTGDAESPTFSDGRSGPFTSSESYVYKTAAQASTVWRRVVTAKLLRCVAAGLTGSSHGVKFTVSRKHLLSLPPIATGRRGYRVVGTATSTDQQVGVYLDQLMLERGRMITAITFGTYIVAPSSSLELRLARKLAARMSSQ